MTALNKQALRINARLASAGEWTKESGDGWEAICSSDDQANAGFIVAHFEGPDAKENREFVQVANPATVLALLDENLQLQRDKDSLEAAAIAMRDDMREAREKLEAAEKRIDELSASHSKLRDTIAAIHNTIRMDGGYTPLAAILNAAKRAYEESASTAGIGVKGE
ncbi:TPA: ead/Ea22-like family protein [Citrobacter braakii]